LRSGSDRSCPLSINQANRCVRPCGARQTLTEECTLRMRTHLETHVALAHTHEQRRVHIRYSSRTPCSVEYTQHIGPAPTRVTIAFTRRPTVAVLLTVSKIQNRSRQHVCKHRCHRRPTGGKLPTPSRHRSPTLTPTVRGSRLTPAAASRCSKICPIDRPRQHVCKHRCDRRPTGGKLHCQRRRAIALPHSLRLRTPTGTVAAAVARWSKIDRVDDRRHYVCQHRRDQRPKVRHTVCRCRANALRHWLRLRAPTGTVTASRVDPPATRWPHALAPHHTERSRNPTVREPAPHRAAPLRTLP
jgi:hypothetical protein